MSELQSCQEVRALWSEHLDGRLPLEISTTVEAHFAGCEACESAWQRYRALFEAARHLPSELPGRAPVWPARSPGFETVQVQGVFAARRARQLRWAAAAAFVAMIGLSHWTLWNLARSGGEDPGAVVGTPVAEEGEDRFLTRDREPVGNVFAPVAFGARDAGARALLRDHADGAVLFLRTLAILPDGAGASGQALVRAQLAGLSSGPFEGMNEGILSGIVPSARPTVASYLRAFDRFRGLATEWALQSVGRSAEDLRQAALESNLMMLALYTRALHSSESAGESWAEPMACVSTRTAFGPRPSELVERLALAQRDLLACRHIEAAREFRSLVRLAAGPRDRALLPLAKVMEAEAFRRAGLVAESWRAMGESGNWTMSARSACVPLLLVDPLFGPHMKRQPVMAGRTRMGSEALLTELMPELESSGSPAVVMPSGVQVRVSLTR